MQAHNPYSQDRDPISFAGWENGFAADPKAIPSQFEKHQWGPRYLKAFYRGQGAQIMRQYDQGNN
jgi:hypothetical protein